MSDYDEFWREPHMKRWAHHVMTDMYPKLAGSNMVMTLHADGKPSVQGMVETGAAVILDKPIILVVFDRFAVPNKLRRVADEIVELPEGINLDASIQLRGAVTRMQERGLM